MDSIISVFNLRGSKKIQPSELVHLGEWWLSVMDIYSNSALILEAMLKFASEAELYFAVKYE